MPAKVVAADTIVFSRDDILGGMNVFQRYGVMEYGSVYGHGAYLGPDFTAEYLHKSAESRPPSSPLLSAPLIRVRRSAVFQRASGLPLSCTTTPTIRKKIRLPGAGQERRRTK